MAEQRILAGARPGPLAATLKDLMRDENPSVREVAVKLCGLDLPAEVMEEVLPSVSRLATEDRVRSVQLAALQLLARKDRARFMGCLADIFSQAGAGQHAEVVEAAGALAEFLLEAVGGGP